MNLKLNLIDFDGPLDLLLTLIKENKMEIENIDISKIATQYLNFIYAQQNIQINEMSEYLLIASTLLWMKSKTILNSTMKLSNDEQQQLFLEKQKLINQILLYKKYKDVSNKLNNLKDKRSTMFAKHDDNIEDVLNKKIPNSYYALPHSMNVNYLYTSLLNAYEKWKLNIFNNQKIIVQEVSTEQVEKEIINIFQKYKNTKKYSLTDLFELIDAQHLSDQYLVTCFICLLDLAKNNKIKLNQNTYDDEIYIDVL